MYSRKVPHINIVSLKEALLGRSFILSTLLCLSFLGTAFAQEQDSTVVEADTTFMAAVLDTNLIVVDTVRVTEDQHPQDSPENRGFLIVTSDGKASLRFHGSIRLHGVYDFNGLQGQDFFVTSQIPVGEANRFEPRFTMSATQSRFGMEATKETRLGETFMRIEGDFRASPNRFRLRHAFGRAAGLLLGQTWSVFSDVEALPVTVDFEGPNSGVSERTPQIRYAKRVSERLRWAVSAEENPPEITRPDSIQSAFQSFPVLVGRIRKTGTWGHLQAAALLRSIDVKEAGKRQNLEGYGALLTGRFVLGPRNEALFSLATGYGIASFIAAFDGQGFDVVFNPTTGKFETLYATGTFLSLRQSWRDNLFTHVTAGLADIIERDFQPDDSFSLSQYISGNLFWQVASGMLVGAEYSWGRRENKNKEDGTANRFSFIIYYDF